MASTSSSDDVTSTGQEPVGPTIVSPDSVSPDLDSKDTTVASQDTVTPYPEVPDVIDAPAHEDAVTTTPEPIVLPNQDGKRKQFTP